MAEEPSAGWDPETQGDPRPPQQPLRAAPSPEGTPRRDPPGGGDPPAAGSPLEQPGAGGEVPKVAAWGRPRRPPARTRLRNRRYAALRQLIQAGDYFSEEEMRARDPLLYQHYIGQYQGLGDPARPGEGVETLLDDPLPKSPRRPPPPRPLSGLLLLSLEEAALRRRRRRQRLQHGHGEEEEEDPSCPPPPAELAMLRQEFTTRMHQRFLAGEDPDFDYSQIDEDPELDNLDIVSQDAEERYFDEEEPSAAPQLD